MCNADTPLRVPTLKLPQAGMFVVRSTRTRVSALHMLARNDNFHDVTAIDSKNDGADDQS
jgi:hypothetical protein